MENFEGNPIRLHCFLCSNQDKLKRIEECQILQSKKSIKSLLIYLAKYVQVDLQEKITSSSSVCELCLQSLTDYDNMVIKLLSLQKQLTKKIAQSTINLGLSDDLGSLEEVNEVHDEEEEEEMSLPDSAELDEEDVELDFALAPLSTSTCHHCGKMFNNKTRLHKHIEEQHKSKLSYKCNICGISARNEEYLDLHMNLHEGKTEMECRYCSKRYTRKVNVIRHMQKHWDKKKFQCEKCGLRFSETPILYNHRLQHEAEEQPLICAVCKQCFKTKRTFRSHMMTHREDRPRFSCETCGKTFVEKYTLKVHRRVHEIINTSDVVAEEKDSSIAADTKSCFTCIICGLNSTNKEQHDQHMQNDHDVVY